MLKDCSPERQKFPTGKSSLLSVKSFSFLLETFRYYPSNFLPDSEVQNPSASVPQFLG